MVGHGKCGHAAAAFAPCCGIYFNHHSRTFCCPPCQITLPLSACAGVSTRRALPLLVLLAVTFSSHLTPPSRMNVIKKLYPCACSWSVVCAPAPCDRVQVALGVWLHDEIRKVGHSKGTALHFYYWRECMRAMHCIRRCSCFAAAAAGDGGDGGNNCMSHHVASGAVSAKGWLRAAWTREERKLTAK